jgi:membrane protein required for colicin V production
VRLSDAILDSKIGALDRSLGFLFGVARGFLLAVVAFAIFSWLAPEKQQPEWVRNAKTRPVLTETADRIVAMLPEDAAATIDGWIKRTGSLATEEPAEEYVPPAKPPAAAPAPAPAPATPQKKSDSTTGPGGPTNDKQKLDALINKNVPSAATAPKQ